MGSYLEMHFAYLMATRSGIGLGNRMASNWERYWEMHLETYLVMHSGG